MCARFTVLSDTPMAAEIAGCVIATLTQQHHLDALALRSRYLPPQRSLQPPHLGFAAFCHLCSPESDGASESQLRCGNQPGLNCLPNLDSSRYGVGIRRIARRKTKCSPARSSRRLKPGRWTISWGSCWCVPVNIYLPGAIYLNFGMSPGLEATRVEPDLG